MLKSLRIFLIACLLLASIITTQAQKIMGYVEDYRYSNITSQEYAALTDVIYSFLEFNTDGTIITSTVNDNTFGWNQSAYATVKSNCKTKKNSGTGPRLHIALGGADKPGNRANRFYTVCSNSSTRSTLVNQVVNWAISEGLYGIAVDWEFPTTAAQISAHESFMHDLRTAINASSDPSLILTIDVGGEYKNTVNHLQYVTATTLSYIDELHIMSYDLPPSYSSNHSTITDAKGALDQWNLTYSFPYNKMLLGVPFYGWDASRNTTVVYNAEGSYTTAYNSTSEGPVNGQYYNSKDALTQKINYVYQKGGLGIVIWAIGQDRQLPDSYSLLGACQTATNSACQAPQPNLGADAGVCLTTTPGGMTLNSNVASASGRTFVWKKDGSTISGSGPTLSGVNTSGTYTVAVTQGGCTRTDDIIVTASTQVSATGGSVCGSGQVTLTASGTGTFKWYDASAGGALLSTGATYKPTVSSTTDFYVQDAGTSVSNNTGKPVMDNTKAALTPFGKFTSATGHTDLGHKVVVSTSLTISSVDFTIAPNMSGSMSVNVVSSADNKTVLQSAGPFSYSTGSSQQILTLPLNLNLSPGTYYLMPVSTSGTGTQQYWVEITSWSATTLLPDYTVPGVISVSGNCFNDYNDGLGVRTTANAVYAATLFNWVVVTGSANACGRTKVTATVTPAASASLAVTTSTPTVCGSGNGTVTVKSSETGISYQAYIGATAVGSAATGTGSDLNITIPGSSLATGSNTITIKATKSGCGTVTLTNTAGIILGTPPAQPSTITGGTTPCAGVATTYSVTSVSGVTYTWAITPSGAGTITGSGNSISVTWTASGSLSVTPSNSCGNGTAQTASVTVTPKPAQPSTITGTATVCAGQNNVVYSVTNVAGVTYNWSYSGNGVSPVGGITANSVTLNFASNATAGNVQVTASNSCGVSTASSLPITITTPPAQPSAITGNATACTGAPATNYSVTNVAGVTYNWTVSPSNAATITGSGNSVSVSWAASGTLSVTAQTTCGTSTASTLAVSVGAGPAQPSAITGNASVCTGASASSYSVTAVSGINYTWSVTPSNAATITGTGNSVSVTWTSSGTLSVTPGNTCGNGTPSTLAVTVGSTPAQPSSITGLSSVCSTTGATTYSVTNVAGVNYNWTVSPSNAATITGTGNSVSVTWTASGTLSVTAQTTCGTSTASTLPVTFGTSPSQPSAITGNNSACSASATGTYSVTNVAGVNYNWTVAPSNAATITGTGNSVSVTWAASGTLSVTAQTSCGTSTASTVAVTYGGAPAQPSTITGTNPACASIATTYTVTNVAGVNYNWTVSPSNAATITGTGNSVSVTWSASGTLSVTAQTSCGTSTASTLAVTVNPVPSQPSAITGTNPACASTATTYSVTNVAGVNYNWTVSPSNAATITGTGNSVSVTWSASGTLNVTPSNTCGNGTPSTLAVTVNSPATQPGNFTVSSASVNQGQTGVIYTVPNVAGVNYTWSYTGGTGATIASGQGTNSVTVDFSASATSGTLQVIASTGCGAQSPARTISITVNTVSTPQPGNFTTSSATVCQGKTGVVYTVPNVVGTTYTWSYVTGTGATVASGQGTNSATFDFSGSATSGIVRVVANNGAGPSAPRDIAVTVNSIPAQPGAFSSGSATPCQGTTGLIYTVPNVSGVNYTWTYSGTGVTFGAGSTTNSVTVDYSATATSGNMQVVAANGCGNSTPQILAINVNSIPAQPGAFTASKATVCQGDIGAIYTVPNVANVTYMWTYSGTGATFASGQGSNSVSVSYSGAATSGNISVTAKNTCGTSGAQSMPVTVNGPAAQPGAFTVSSASVTQGQTGVIYTVPNVSGVIYTWSYTGTGATFTSGQNTNSVTVDFSASATNGNIQVIANNGCGANSSAQSIAVTVTSAQTPQPGNFTTSTATVCQGKTGVIYTVPNVAGTTYTWSYVTGTGATVASGQGTNSATFDFSPTATSGVVRVVANNGAGNSAPRDIAVTVNPAAAQPGSFTASSATVCQGKTGVVYTVPNVAGVNYAWTFSGTGASFASGQGTNSVTVDFSASATNGNIQVTAANTCGTSSPQSMAVAVNNLPAQPGSFTVSTATVCQGKTGVVYTVPNVAGVNYAWTFSGTGASFASGQGTNSVTVDFSATSTSGNIQVTASNTCGTSSPQSMAVSVNSAAAQPGAFTASSSSVSQGQTGVIYTVPNVPGVNYTWSYVTGTGATIASGQGTNSVTVDFSATATNGTIQVIASNTCGTSIARSIGVTVTTVTTPQPGNFTTSSGTVCQGNTGIVYTVPNVAGTTYTWSYVTGTGVTIAAGQGTNSATFDFSATATSGIVRVVADNGAGNSAPRDIAVTVNAAATQPGAFTVSTAAICPGQNAVVYTVPNVTGVNFAWTYTGTGATFASGQGTNSVSVNYSSSVTAGDIQVTASNTCGTSQPRAITISLNSVPAAPASFTASTAAVCQGQTAIVYTVPATANVQYAWSYSGSGFVFASGQGTNSVSVNVGSTATSGNIQVTASNACGASSPLSMAVTVNSVPTQPAAFTASSSSVCQGQTGVAFTVPSVANVNYAWTYSGSGATFSSGQGTNSVMVDFSSSATTGSIKVVASNTCGTSSGRSQIVTLNSLPTQPVFNTSTTSVCQNTTGIAYSVSNQSNANFDWSYTGAGATFALGQGTNSVTVNYSSIATSGNIQVVAKNTCGTSASQSVAVTINTAPTQPASFATSTAAVNAGQTGVAYSVAAVAGATKYTWAYSGTGATINNNGNRSVTIDFSSSATSGNLTVTADNSCGSSTALSLAITVSTSNNNGGGVGPISAGQNPVTAGVSTNVSYCVPAVAGTTYIWSYSGTGETIHGNGSNCVTIDFGSSATSGTLSVQAMKGGTNSGTATLDISVIPINAVVDPLAGVSLTVYPNPIENISVVAFELPTGMNVNLEVYNMHGLKMGTLVENESYGAGNYEVPMTELPSGVYIVKLKLGNREKNIKVVKN